MHEIVTDQVTASAAIVFIIQLLKKWQRIPWINATSDNVNRLLGALFAACTAVGIHGSWDSATGTLTIAGITLTAVLHGLWDWTKSMAFQELIYHAAVKSSPKP